jgi:hypothetical protein
MKTKNRVLAVLLMFLVVLGFTAGCSAKDTAKDATTSSSGAAADASYQRSTDDNISINFNESVEKNAVVGAAEAPKATGIRGTGIDSSFAVAASPGSGPVLDILAQRKIIRNANLSLEVDDFYNAYGNLQSMITGIGYVQESNIHRDFYTHNDERKTRVSGNIIVRVDARRFDDILNDIKGLGEVIDDRIYSTDVTDQFYDTEGRLKILKIEYDYLEEYMMSLNDPDSIFKTRMRMTELQTEIERLTGTLNKWSDLVELSTINIQMNEKYPEDVKQQTYTYWDRLKDSVSNSLTGIVRAMGNLVIFIIEVIPTLVVLGLIGFVGYRLFKKYSKRRKESLPEEKTKNT